jgi:hypothetical protein
MAMPNPTQNRSGNLEKEQIPFKAKLIRVDER